MGTRVQAIKNLKKKGAEANPNGRPKKGYSITEIMRELLQTPIDGKDVRLALGKSILEKALKGDIAAQKMVWQYMDGMPQQNVDLKSGDEPLSITFNFGNDEEK